MLWKTYSNLKLALAFDMMRMHAPNQKRHVFKVTSKVYEKLKLDLSNYQKLRKMTCKWCNKSIHPTKHSMYHGDKCLLNPALSSNEVQQLKNYRNRYSAIGNANASVKVECPHCGKTGGQNAMKRKHFDNCFLNPNLSNEQKTKLELIESQRRINVSKQRKENGIPFPVNITTLREKIYNQWNSQ